MIVDRLASLACERRVKKLARACVDPHLPFPASAPCPPARVCYNNPTFAVLMPTTTVHSTRTIKRPAYANRLNLRMNLPLPREASGYEQRDLQPELWTMVASPGASQTRLHAKRLAWNTIFENKPSHCRKKFLRPLRPGSVAALRIIYTSVHVSHLALYLLALRHRRFDLHFHAKMPQMYTTSQ